MKNQTHQENKGLLEPKNTKETFLLKSLELFAERGYEAVSVADIAKEVGCSAPALYKHFKSKQDLFDSLLKMSEDGYARRMQALNDDFALHPEKREEIVNISEEEQVAQLQNLVRHTVHDKLPLLFRRLMTIEQFRNQKLARDYNERYVNFQYRQYEALFKMMMEAGKLKKADPHTLAVNYISAAIVMIGYIDREPEKEEEAMKVIADHVKEFNRNYRI